MSKYTTIENDIYFLNDKNITQNLHNECDAGFNSIPSLSLLQETAKTLSGMTNATSVDVEGQINAVSGFLSDEIEELSDYVKGLDIDVELYKNQQIIGNSPYISVLTHLKQTDGQIAISATQLLSSHINGLEEFVSAAVESLDVAEQAEANKFIRKISEKDGKISVEFDKVTSSDIDGFLSSGLIEGLDDWRGHVETSAFTLSTHLDSKLAEAKTNLSDDYIERINDKARELSTYSDSYTNTAILDLSNSISATANSKFAKYDNFEFDFNKTAKSLALTLKNENDNSKTLSIDVTEFITSGIIHHVNVDNGNLSIYWEKADGDKDATVIPLGTLVPLYDAGFGINIDKTDEGFNFSVDKSEIATSAAVNDAIQRISVNETNITTLTSKQSEILQYTTKLSSDGGIINSLSGKIGDISAHNLTQDTSINSNISRISTIEIYTTKLSSTDGIIDTLSNDVELLEKASINATTFTYHIRLNANDRQELSTKTIAEFFSDPKYGVKSDIGTVKNGAIYDVIFTDLIGVTDIDILKSSTLIFRDGTKFAHKDYIIVHRDNVELTELQVETISLSDIYVVPAVRLYEYYQLSATVRDNYLWLSGNNSLANQHAISGNNDYLGLNRFNSISVENLSATELSANNADITKLSVVDEVFASFMSLKNSDADSKYSTLQNFITLAELSLDTLSDDLDHKIYVNGKALEQTNLSIIHINQNDYHELVVNDKCLSNTLYVVSSDYLNMYGQQIKNLAEPTELSDATTMKYVNNVSSFLNNKLDDEIADRIAADKNLCIELSNVLSTYTDTSIDILSGIVDDRLASNKHDSDLSTASALTSANNYTNTQIAALSINTYAKQDSLNLSVSELISDISEKLTKPTTTIQSVDINETDLSVVIEKLNEVIALLNT